jgi:hypothetical protein
MLVCRLRIKFGEDRFLLFFLHQSLLVLNKEGVLTALQIRRLQDVETVSTIVELQSEHVTYSSRRNIDHTHLNDAVVTIAHSQIIIDHQAFKMLDDAALQISTTTGLHSRVHQTLSASHAMEEVLLRPNTSEEAASNKTARPRGGIVWHEGREGSTAE